MSKTAKELILYTTLIAVGLFFIISGIVRASAFLIPFTLGTLLAMIMLPVDKKLRDWHVPRILSAIISALALLSFCIGIFSIVGAQIDNVSDEWPEYKKKLTPKIEKVQIYIQNELGIPQEKQIEQLKKLGKNGPKKAGAISKKVLTGTVSFTGNFLLVFVYIFFFLYYRTKFRNAVLNFVTEKNTPMASNILVNISKVSQQYLFGRFLLILFLSIIYSVGLLIIGIKHAVLVALLAALLSLIPYFGNIIGFLLAVFMSLLTNASLGEIIGILIVFTIAQIIENYILEPYIVGRKVEINPVVTIIGVILGGLIWGIAGTILSIPILGILKVVFDSIPMLNPLGYILDEKDTGSDSGSFQRLKEKVSLKFQQKK